MSGLVEVIPATDAAQIVSTDALWKYVGFDMAGWGKKVFVALELYILSYVNVIQNLVACRV